MTSEQGKCRAAPRKYSDFNALNISFMREHGLTPCFAWAATTSVFHAPRLELYRTAESIEELEFWSREARVLRNGKKAVVWRHGDLKFDFMHGIMDLKDAQGTRWTSDKWDLLRSGLKAAKVKEPSEMPASPGGEPREQQGLQQGLQQLNGNKENGHGKAEEMVLSLIKKLPADQRRMLSGKLRATEADTTIDQGRKAEIASGIIAKAAESLEQQISQEEDMPKRVEVPCGVEESQGPGRAWEATKSYALSLPEHRKDMLRVILNDEAIDREWKNKMASDLLTNWFNEDAQGGALLDPAEEQPERVHLSVSAVVSSGVDIDNGKQDMGELAPLEEQQGQEFAEDRDQGLSETEVASDSDVGSTREELWPPEEGTPDGEIRRVTGLSEASVLTIKEIIAGDDVKAKDIGKSVDFPVGGVIRDDSIVSIMSMDYEGCCLQEESMEIQCQERGVVDYDYDDGDTISAKFNYGRPAFAPGGIGMFVVTGRPPGRLIGG